MSVAAAIGGTAIGGAFGAVLARSGVCSNAAIRRAVFDRDLLLARIIAVAIVVQMALLPAAVAAGADVAPPRLYVVAGAVGGFLFGIGMAAASGCATGILWKSGTGSGAGTTGAERCLSFHR